METLLYDREDTLDAAFNGYGREKMGVLSRYEVTLDRTLFKCLHELQRLQALRRGETVPHSAIRGVLWRVGRVG